MALKEPNLTKMEETDRISSLPDCLIHHMLSFLTTKESVRTTVLSKRWINVWKSAPCLDVDASDFNQAGSFETFVNSILYHKIFPKPEQLDTFNLTWHTCNEESHQAINVWIYNLVSLKPKEVYIDVSKLDEIYFVSYLFNCASLERLYLWPQMSGAWGDLNPPVVNLPFLKCLNLGWVNLQDEFMQRLIKGCPVLEELGFENCFLDVTEKITSSSLKRLIILNSVIGFDEGVKLRVCMPNLEYLKCQVHLGRVSFKNLSSLEYASINLYGMRNDYDGKEVKLLRSLSNAKTLQLSGFYVNNLLKKEVVDLPVFEKLKSLDLVSFTISEKLDPIELFLRRTPNLEKLTLQNISVEKHGGLQRRRFPQIQCDSLKTVEIVCLETDEEVGELAKSLIVYLKAVENISINRVNEIDDYSPQFLMQGYDSDSP